MAVPDINVGTTSIQTNDPVTPGGGNGGGSGNSTSPQHTSYPRDLKVALPSEFNGEQGKAKEFLHQISLNIAFWEATRKPGDQPIPDDAKILFTLSFMKGGTAGPWGQEWLRKTIEADEKVSWKEFLKEFATAFRAEEDEARTRQKLMNLRQGKDTVEGYTTTFNLLRAQSGITQDEALQDFYLRGLDPKITERIFNNPTLPENLAKLQTMAKNIDFNVRRAQNFLHFGRGGTTSVYDSSKMFSTNNSKTTTTTSTHDPNAMDVDRLTAEERTEYFRKGLCFSCGKTGHLSRDCPNKPKKKDRGDGKWRGKFNNRNRRINAIEQSDDKEEEREEMPNDDNTRLRVNMVKTLIDGLSNEAREELFDRLDEEADEKDFQ